MVLVSLGCEAYLICALNINVNLYISIVKMSMLILNIVINESDIRNKANIEGCVLPRVSYLLYFILCHTDMNFVFNFSTSSLPLFSIWTIKR